MVSGNSSCRLSVICLEFSSRGSAARPGRIYLTRESPPRPRVSQDVDTTGDFTITKGIPMTRVAVSMFASILALAAACTSTETSDSSAIETGDITEFDSAGASGAPARGTPDDVRPAGCVCEGPAPSLPSQICSDGTVAGPECVATPSDGCAWIITECPDPQPTDCSQSDCPTGQHCEIDCHPCDAPDPKTPCDSFTCQSTCVPD